MLYVEMVVPGSVADQGGVKAGDVVSAVNGDHDAVVANHTPDLFVAYVTPLVRPITLTFERTTISDDDTAEPTAKPVAASDGEGSFATAPAAAEDAEDSSFGGDDYLAASLLAIATEKLDVAFPEGAMGISVGNIPILTNAAPQNKYQSTGVRRVRWAKYDAKKTLAQMIAKIRISCMLSSQLRHYARQ